MIGRVKSGTKTEQNPPLPEGHLELLLTEYKALRDEILKRMDHRLTLLVTSLTVSGTILGFGLQLKNGVLLLLAPVVTVLFGLLVINHSRIIAEMGRHLVNNIETPIQARYPGALTWHGGETWQRIGLRGRMSVFHLPVLLTTVLPTVAALALCWQYEGALAAKITGAAVDTLLLVVYIVFYKRQHPTGVPAISGDAPAER